MAMASTSTTLEVARKTEDIYDPTARGSSQKWSGRGGNPLALQPVPQLKKAATALAAAVATTTPAATTPTAAKTDDSRPPTWEGEGGGGGKKEAE